MVLGSFPTHHVDALFGTCVKECVPQNQFLSSNPEILFLFETHGAASLSPFSEVLGSNPAHASLKWKYYINFDF